MITYVRESEAFKSFKEWVNVTYVLGFDTETNVTNHAPERELYFLQFGTWDDQYIFYYDDLLTNPEWMDLIRCVLKSTRWVKIAHNVSFDAGVCYLHGLELHGCYDTMLSEMVLKNGMLMEYPSYAELVYNTTGRILGKQWQTSFTRSPDVSREQIQYMGDDVKFIIPVYRDQLLRLHQENLEYVAALESDAALCYGEMEVEGVGIDVPYWLSLKEKAMPIVEDAKKVMDEWLEHKDFESCGWRHIAQEDIIQLPLNAPNKLRELMNWVYPGLEGTSKPVVGRYLARNNATLATEDAIVLQAFAAGDKSPLADMLLARYKEELIKMEYVIPKGTRLINWNSVPQVLPLAQVLSPKIKDLSAESTAKQSHPFFVHLSEYKDALKLISTYGEAFIQKHVEKDGKIRTSYNQIVETGRVSSRSPNMQNIPVKEAVGNMYRNAFTAPEGWLFVDSDYASQELVIIAEASGDPVWLKALKEGRDLHSVCAELIFKRKWKEGAEADCAYYKGGAQLKCKCKVHKRLRDWVKTINFGLAYGLSHFGLAARLSISVQEAKNLIAEYFTTFPRIKRILTAFGEFGVKYGYIITLAPFYRKRWFPMWEYCRRYVDAHIAGIQEYPELLRIDRQSKNTPVQGSAADMIKTATVLIRNYLCEHQLRDKIKLVLQVHDQNTTIARQDIAEWWRVEMTRLMEEAALLIVRSGLLKAETNISERWSK